MRAVGCLLCMNPGRGGDDAQQPDFARTPFRQDVERGRAGMPGCQHRVEREDVGAAQILRQVGVIGHGCERLGIAEEAQVGDDRIVDDRQKAGQESEAGT